MANANELDLSSVAKLRAFLKRHPPLSPDSKAFGSAILVHLEAREREFERLRIQGLEIAKAVSFLAQQLLGTPPSEEPAPSAESEPAAAEERDQTPFPAGVRAQTGGYAGPVEDDQATAAAPAMQNNSAVVQTAPATPPQVPKRSSKNGAKEVS